MTEIAGIAGTAEIAGIAGIVGTAEIAGTRGVAGRAEPALSEVSTAAERTR